MRIYFKYSQSCLHIFMMQMLTFWAVVPCSDLAPKYYTVQQPILTWHGKLQILFSYIPSHLREQFSKIFCHIWCNISSNIFIFLHATAFHCRNTMVTQY